MDKTRKKFSKEIFELAGGYKYLTILACVLSGISSILSLLPFVFIWMLVRDILTSYPDLSKLDNIVRYGWWAVGSAVASVILYFTALMCSHIPAFRVEKNMRKKAMHGLMNLPLGFFKTNASGRIRKIIDDNASLTHGFVAHQLPDLAGAVVIPFAILSILFFFDWRLGLVCLFPLALGIIFLSKLSGGQNVEIMQKFMNYLEEMNNSAVEYVRGIPVVKVFQQTVYSFKNFHKSIENYREFVTKYAFSCRIPMTNFTISINAPSLILIPVGLLFIMNAKEPKTFLLNLIFYMLFIPVCTSILNKIMYVSDNLMQAKEALARIDEIISEEKLEFSEDGKKAISYDINFEHVSFTYPGSKEKTLKNINFKIPEGKIYALVGPSGGGKSTIASLIPRFWDVDQGSIKVGDVDIRKIREEDLVENIAFVFQDNRLFKKSLLDNIQVANPGATREEVERAASLAQCDDIIEKLPDGLDTIVGEKGVYLSGGEVQRICIARAILKDAPIVILDEATAFADPENESKIQKAFEFLIKGKTVLIIAHRLSTIKNVDRIVVVDDGKISESGNHDELLEKGRMYSMMWKDYISSIEWKVEKEAYNA